MVVGRFRVASPIVKVAITWGLWATICLTGYYFARQWAGQQKGETLKIRQTMNNKFSEQLEQARQDMESNESAKK